jgi:hypothetical protein
MSQRSPPKAAYGTTPQAATGSAMSLFRSTGPVHRARDRNSGQRPSAVTSAQSVARRIDPQNLLHVTRIDGRSPVDRYQPASISGHLGEGAREEKASLGRRAPLPFLQHPWSETSVAAAGTHVGWTSRRAGATAPKVAPRRRPRSDESGRRSSSGASTTHGEQRAGWRAARLLCIFSAAVTACP